MPSNTRSTNFNGGLTAQSTITGKQEYITSTGGILNSGATLSGLAIPASGLTTAAAVQIVDDNGNQITSFGGGTQYINGSTQATPTGTVALGWDSANVRALKTATDGTLKTQLDAAQSNTTGTITTSSSVVTATDLTGIGAVTIQISGTYVGVNVTFETSVDGTNWVGIAAQALGSITPSLVITTGVLTSNSLNIWNVAPLLGVAQFRVRATAYTSGTANVIISPSAQFVQYYDMVGVSGTIPVSQSGTWNIGSSSATSSAVPANAFYIAGNLAGNLTGITIIAPNDGQAAQNGLYTTTANEIYNGTNFDRMRSVINGTNSTGTGITATGVLGQFDDVSPTSITENQFGNLRMSANRNLYGTIRDAAGNERGVNVTSANALVVDGSAVTQPVSGTVTSKLQDGSGANLTSTAGSLNVVAQASTATLSNVASSATSVTVLASNTSRKGAEITNDSSALLYLKFGSTASTTSYTVVLAGSAAAPFSYYEVPAGYTGIITGIWASATGNARVTEIT